jgi:uracil-DNA glycosylase
LEQIVADILLDKERTMRVSECVGCKAFPCADVKHESYLIPSIELAPERVSVILISEAAPADPADHYYAAGNPLFGQTTVQAFRDAGAEVSSIHDILALGVYLTPAVKCGKTGYGIEKATIAECSRLLEQEIALFPKVVAYLLMGDVAIQAVNAIAKRAGEPRVIPAGPTYKIRDQASERPFLFRGARAFPSYLQAGPSFFIEKSKRRMIAEDIAAALRLARRADPKGQRGL